MSFAFEVLPGNLMFVYLKLLHTLYVLQVWDKCQKFGEEMVLLASNLSSMSHVSCQKHVKHCYPFLLSSELWILPVTLAG